MLEPVYTGSGDKSLRYTCYRGNTIIDPLLSILLVVSVQIAAKLRRTFPDSLVAVLSARHEPPALPYA